jgi:hypothetical protein
MSLWNIFRMTFLENFACRGQEAYWMQGFSKFWVLTGFA